MTEDICRFCGEVSKEGTEFDKWVKPTFTDFDKLLPGNKVCNDCLFWFDESSAELQARMAKDKPQRMRNYSHFVVNGEWIPLSKGNKSKMAELLLSESFPELAAITDSGQKHIVFRAVRNAIGSSSGWIQFEEQRIYVTPQELRELLETVEELYETFGKTEIETGNYAGYRILQFGVERWLDLEDQIKNQRGKPIFALAIFLAQRSDDGKPGIAIAGERHVGDPLERDASRLQEQIPDDYLEPVRVECQERGVYEQSGEVRQLAMFETQR